MLNHVPPERIARSIRCSGEAARGAKPYEGSCPRRSAPFRSGGPPLSSESTAEQEQKKGKKEKKGKKGIINSLTSGDLDTLGLKVLRVAGGHGAPLAELLELVDLLKVGGGRWKVPGGGAAGGGGGGFKVRGEMKVDRGPRKRANARGASERGNHERGANAPFFDRDCGAAKPLLPFFFGPREKNESASLLGRQQQNDRRRRGQAKARSRTRAGRPCASTLANARSARRSTLPTASQNLIRIVARRRGV